MANPQDTLRELMEKRQKKNEVVEIKTNRELINTEKILNFSFFSNLNIDKEEENYLISKTKEVISLQAGATLELGKILEEVSEHLSKQGSKDGIFEKFLEYNGINTKSARRYRHRYQLYNRAKADVKPIIALLSVKEIETLYKCPEILDDITEGITLEEAKELFQKDPPKKLLLSGKLENHLEFSFLNEDFQVKLESLSDDKKEQAYKLLEKLSKIIEF